MKMNFVIRIFSQTELCIFLISTKLLLQNYWETRITLEDGTVHIFVSQLSWDHQKVIQSRSNNSLSALRAVSLSDDGLLVGPPLDFVGGYGYNGCNETEEIPGAGTAYVFDTTLWDESSNTLGIFGGSLDQKSPGHLCNWLNNPLLSRFIWRICTKLQQVETIVFGSNSFNRNGESGDSV
jgi:hypothetical protein